MGSLILTMVLSLAGAEDAGSKCPVSGKAAKAEHFLFEKVYFCCKNCQGDFAKENGLSLDPGTCPISGQPAKQEFFLIDGDKVVHFCCAKCQKKSAEENGLAVDLKLGEVGNCPVSAEPADGAVFAIRKVNFCCPNCRKQYAVKRGLTIDFKAAAPAEKTDAASGPVCPISSKPANPAHWIMSEGKKLTFCCERCPTKYISERENRLSDAQRESHWGLLFNGKDLAGFQKPTRDGKWEVKDGILIGSGGGGVLATKDEFDNFELLADIRVSDTGERRGNSGIFIRSTGLLGDNGNWPDGLEIQVDHGDENYWTGSIWATATAKKVETKDKEWFSLRIEAAGPRIRVWVNNVLVTDHLHPEEVQRGPIAIQVHHPTDVVEVKNLKIRALEAS